MLIQGQVGPLATTASLPSGTQSTARFGNMGDLIVSELHGRYYEAAYRRQMFNAANQAAATTTVGLATTYTGLCLSNPIGSPVNLVLNKIGLTFIVAFPAGAAVGLMCGFNGNTNVTHTTPGVVHSNFFNNQPVGYGLVDTAATLPTAPFVTHLFGSGLTGAITTVPDTVPAVVDLEGSIILPPGAYAAVYTSTVSGTSGFLGSFSWEEVPA